MPLRTFIFNRYLKLSIGLWVVVLGLCTTVLVAHAAYERYATGDTAVIGEFVYDDNFVATTTAACTLSIYNPSGSLIVNAGSMTSNANGFTFYSYSVPTSSPEGVWPSQMTCGNVSNGDLVKMDKTFVVGATLVSTTTLASSVWTSASRSLTTFGTLVADVWTNATRTLTGATLTSGSLATLSDLTTATSSLASAITVGNTSVNANTTAAVLAASSSVGSLITGTNSLVTSASSSLAAVITSLPATIWAYSSRSLTSFGTVATDVWNAATRTLTSPTLIISPWTVTTSDFGSIVAGSNYLATVTTIYNGTLTDSANVPIVTIYDPSRNVIVNNVVMTRTATGTYSYSYTTSGSAPAGTWESVFSANVESGKTLPGNDYWTVATTPAQVIINSISDDIIPQVAANVTITNEGLSGNEYQYEWCVVSNVNNMCGDGDDVFHAVAAKYINSGEDFNTTLTADVSTAGNYYFKVIVYFGTDSSGASRSFTAQAGASTGGSGATGGGGGGGGGGNSPTANVTNALGHCGEKIADFNCDLKVNSIDFSILLYFWKAQSPFANTYVDINKDNKVDSVDFSILLYRWDKK